MSDTFTMFHIFVDGDARAWADAKWDTYGFDFDTERTGGGVVHAWALECADEELAAALTEEGVRFVTHEARASELWPDAHDPRAARPGASS